MAPALVLQRSHEPIQLAGQLEPGNRDRTLEGADPRDQHVKIVRASQSLLHTPQYAKPCRPRFRRA